MRYLHFVNAGVGSYVVYLIFIPLTLDAKEKGERGSSPNHYPDAYQE
jgi:hypothetical protein